MVEELQFYLKGVHPSTRTLKFCVNVFQYKSLDHRFFKMWIMCNVTLSNDEQCWANNVKTHSVLPIVNIPRCKGLLIRLLSAQPPNPEHLWSGCWQASRDLANSNSKGGEPMRTIRPCAHNGVIKMHNWWVALDIRTGTVVTKAATFRGWLVMVRCESRWRMAYCNCINGNSTKGTPLLKGFGTDTGYCCLI